MRRRAAERDERVNGPKRARIHVHDAYAVALFNARATAGLMPGHYPTLRAAIELRRPWLRFLCPACRTIGELDLRTLIRHPAATLASLIPNLSCKRCSPNPPLAWLLRVARRSFAEQRGIAEHRAFQRRYGAA